MAACTGNTCQLIMYKVSNIKVEGFPAAPAPGSNNGCKTKKNTKRNRDLVADLIKEKVESSPDIANGDGCPEGCTCVPAAPVNFGPPTTYTWTATLVVTSGSGANQRVCRYLVKGTYDKASAIVAGVCTDLDDELGETPVQVGFDDADNGDDGTPTVVSKR